VSLQQCVKQKDGQPFMWISEFVYRCYSLQQCVKQKDGHPFMWLSE